MECSLSWRFSLKLPTEPRHPTPQTLSRRFRYFPRYPNFPMACSRYSASVLLERHFPRLLLLSASIVLFKGHLMVGKVELKGDAARKLEGITGSRSATKWARDLCDPERADKCIEKRSDFGTVNEGESATHPHCLPSLQSRRLTLLIFFSMGEPG